MTMPPTPKRAKTETLSLRLDPKTKFMLDFVSRVQGQSITTVVERAVKDAAKKIDISAEFESTKTWIDFWNPSEGIRTLNLIRDPEYPTNYEEDEILAFANAHWEFFFTDLKNKTPREGYVDVLWPKMAEYQAIWAERKQSNYWAAGEAMKADLKKAGLSAPEWPRPSKNSPPKNTGPKESFDLDDEIPF